MRHIRDVKLQRVGGSRGVTVLCLCIGLLSAIGGCSDGTAPAAPGQVHVRVVNAVFQGSTSASATAQPIDFMVDSSTSGPGVAGLAPVSLSSGDSANGYRLVSRSGNHSFIALLKGSATPGNPLYTVLGNGNFIGRDSLAAGGYYTIVVAGIVPDAGAVPANNVPFVILKDDPSASPTIQGTSRARFTVVHAAPYASPNGLVPATILATYLTPGSTPPTGPITSYAVTSAVNYRDHAPFVDVDPGTYVLTIASGATILAQQPMTFAAGEVRTFVLMSSSASASPGTTNHVLVSVLDHKYGQ